MHDYAGAYPLNAEDEHAFASEQGFADFVARHAQFAYRVAFAFLRNASDAEDAVQETFLKLYRTGRWHGAENERAYLARVTWRTAINMSKGMRSRETRRAFSQSFDENAASEPASREPSPEQQVIDADTHATVHRLIDTLPEALRQPLVLSSIQEMRSAEVAALLRLPESTVRRRVMEARALLREKLRAMSQEVHRAR